jgi:ABC-type branched-subunit amino acid transport system ATPase component/ABC-type branched-subunit amino acid transport system permease subunit
MSEHSSRAEAPKDRLSRLGADRNLWVVLAAVAALAVIPPASAAFGNFGIIRWEEVLSVAMLAISMNLVTGYSGLLTLGPGAVFAASAYAGAYVVAHDSGLANLAFLCLVGVVAALVVSVVTGAPALRVGGFYLALVTLFFAQIVPVIATNTSSLGGSGGFEFFGTASFVPKRLAGVGLYEITVAVTLIIVLGQYLVRRSRVGRRLFCLKTSEELTSSLGVSPYRTKVLALLVSAVPAGLAGAFYLASQQFISPDSVSTTLSINVLEAIVLGGIASTWGPIAGTVLVVGLTPLLGPLREYSGIITGLLLLAVVLVAPEGIAGSSWMRRVLGTSERAAWETEVTEVPKREEDDAARGASQAYLTRVLSARRDTRPRGPQVAGGHPPDLVVEGVSRRFGGVLAVDQVDLTVKAGEIQGLVGSNGSGKTTLLNLISGFNRVDAGTVSLGDVRLDRLSSTEIAKAGIGRTFQAPKLIMKETLLENVLVAAEQVIHARDASSVIRLPAARAAHKEAVELAMRMLDVVGLGSRHAMLADEASHGILRLVEVARCLARLPQYLLLDEPAAGLGVGEMEVLQAVLGQVAHAGTGLLLVEHNVPFVMGLAEQITVLDQGRVIAHGTREVIENDPKVIEAFLGTAAYA